MESYLLWSGGYFKCEDGKPKYYHPAHTSSAISSSAITELKQEFSGYTTASTTADSCNFTDADLFIYTSENLDNDNKPCIFKTKCSSDMVCKYSGVTESARLFNNNTYIWYAEITHDNQTPEQKLTVACDYDSFNSPRMHNEIRMPSNFIREDIDTSYYLPSENSYTVKYSFTRDAFDEDIDKPIPTGQTNYEMFMNCSALTYCSIPCGMHTIAERTFKGCTNLQSYKVNKNFLTTIKQEAFSGCTSLKEIEIPVFASIGESSFTDCTSAEKIVWDGINDSFDYASGNPSVVSSLTKCNMTDIPNNAFRNCSKLSYVNIPIPITDIRDSAFYNCSGLTSIWLCSVSGISDNAFNMESSNGSSLKGINGFSNVISVGDRAFFGNNSLERIDSMFGYYTNPNYDLDFSIERIGEEAFSGCSALENFDFHNVYSMGDRAFANCTNLKGSSSGNIIQANLANLDYIPIEAFFQCSGLSAVTLCTKELGVTYYNLHIRERAFAETSLTSLTVPQKTKLYKYAFSRCSALTEVVFGSGCTLDDDSFNNCESLSSVTITEDSSVSQYGSCFKNSSSITKVELTYDRVIRYLNDAFNTGTTITFYVPSGQIPNYESTYSGIDNWHFSAITN